jgi:hypothetical protein
MPCTVLKATFRPALGLLALAAVSLAVATSPAGAADHAKQRLVVRGDATAVDAPCDANGVCPVTLTDGRFRGALGEPGAYTGSLKLYVAHPFPNGEGGICATLKGRIVLGAGTPNRLVLAVSGVSCQDGAGPLPSASFTGLAQFCVKHATGSYAGVTGSGLASFFEDAAKHHRMTLIGGV